MMRLPTGFSTLDLKVGLRMLARYPGLTVVGTIAIAVAVALGTIYFEAVDKFQNPRLPLSDGRRIVQILNWDVKGADGEPVMLGDLAAWRGHMKTIELLGASNQFIRNLITEDGRVDAVNGAEVTANAFRLMGAQALLGRTLLDRDENPTEPPVAVIGEGLWKSRFDRSSDILGRSIKVGTTTATIVGVMPGSFRFPMNQHLWLPLRDNGASFAPHTGPALSVWGRLAPGSSLEDARAEAAVIGGRLTAQNPSTHEFVRPRVQPFAKPLSEGGEARFVTGLLYIVNSIFMMLLAVMCTNVATLVFARTATRSWEITVRSALGASRGRIIGQLFAEALVLSSVATILGLVTARVALRFGIAQLAITDALPFWIDATLSWRTLLYSTVLTVFGAAIIGILPALRVTRVNIQDMLRSESAGRAGLKFGGFWTAVIVVQVAITVMFLPLAGGGVFESNRFNQRAEGIGADRFLTAAVGIEREDYALDSATYSGRVRNSIAELERRLSAEPGVERVAFADRLPVEDQFKYQIIVDSAAAVGGTGLRTSTLVHVSGGFFSAFGTSLLAGRDFARIEFEPNSRVLIVNEAFARNVFGQRNPIGERVQIGEGEVNLRLTKGDWFEIIGVVKNFGWQLPRPEEQSAIYRPSLPGIGRASALAVRVREPGAFSNRLRALTAEVDPTIRLTSVQLLTKVGGGEAELNWALTAVAWLVGFIVLLLSATGIHALMSFTVARRTREIGIRTALGADSRKIVGDIFSRAFFQVGSGVVVGSALAAWAGLGDNRALMLLLASDAIMLTVGMAACALPVLRALRVNPTDALRAE